MPPSQARQVASQDPARYSEFMGEMLSPGGGPFAGRFRATTLLRRGLGVDTWRGTDLSGGDPVIIKLAAAAEISPGARLRLEHDAEVLRNLDVPWIAPILWMGDERDVFFLVAPLVTGVTLARRLARTGRLSVPDALAVGRGLMRALRAVHERGVLHRHVKPADVVLGEGSRQGQVTLVDFGLARSERLDASLRDLLPRTIAYVSPEQAGLVHSEVGERSDLYSVGIVLFECLAGRPPFEGASVGELLRQHLSATPPALGHDVPRALADVVRRLLEKDPRDRYQSAAGALADLDEIATAVEGGVRQPEVVVGAHDRRRTLTEAAFVGRDQELHAFEDQLAGAPRGASLLLLEGESGAGKTRMLDHAAVIARQHGAWVLRGQGTDRAAAQRPLHVLDGVVGEVTRAARDEPGFADALRTRLGDHLATLCSALPPLLDLLAPGMLIPIGPEAHGEARVLPALITLIDALGSSTRPAVILLDDCQWLDELSLKLLVSWHRAHRDAPGAGGVLVVAAYRSDEVSIDSPLRHLPPAPRVALGPLAGEQVGQIAESMAGALPPEAVALVVRLSEGNPFLAVAVLEGLVEDGALVGTPRGWELEPRAMAQAQSSRRAAAFLARRLDLLSPRALELLSVGAVLGKSFELKLAADLADQPPAEAMAGVAEARRRHLLWMESPDGRCVFVHDRLRDAVLQRLPEDERVRLHHAAALTLERTPPDPEREFNLAYHFDAAGDHVRALPHALAAAAQARAQYALEIAERFYRIAERGASHESADAQTRRTVAEALGDVLLMRGRYDEAGARLAQARALAQSPLEQAAIEGKIGELAFKRGDVRGACDALERALRLLGRRVPAGRMTVALAMASQALVQVAHTLLPHRLVARRRLEEGEADLLAARVFSRLAYAYWFRRGQVATFWAHLSELNLAERYPPTRELGQACSEHSISVTGLPRFFFPRGVRYAERGLVIRRALGDVWGQGQSLNFHGMLLYAFGHYPEAREKFGEALRVLRRTGDRWEANIAGAHIAYCHLRLGALREAVAECRRVHREGLEIGDAHAMGVVLEVWSKATGGAVPPALIDAAMRSSEGDPQTREAVLQAEGVRRIGAGEPDEAAKAFSAADQIARSAKLKSEYVSYLPLWIAHARRLCSIRAARATGVILPAPLREAATVLRRGLRSARRYRGNLPMALRERAHLRAIRGRFRKARRDLDASLAEAERQGAGLEAAMTLLARGELGRVLRWPGAEADAARAVALLHEMGADFANAPLHTLAPADGRSPATLSLADRFASIVEQGRRIASALTADEVHATLCEAASVLLRGQTIMVLATDGAEPRLLRSLGGPPEFSRSLIERAREERRPVIVAEPIDEPLHDSGVPSTPRSALCAPILVRGRHAACVYVTHARVADVFSDDEKQLAGYLADLAGASLERAETVAALQALSYTLEQRVADRTRELGATNAELETTLHRLRDVQGQLMQTAKMAAVGNLVAGLSHEINGPLGVILGFATTHLRRMRADDPLRPALEAIERQARRAGELVGTFLDFARKRPAERVEVAVDALVQQVVMLATLKARRKETTIELAMPPPGTCLVRVSRTHIESALLNLLDNAIDASPPGAVVRIEAVPCERRSSRGVELRVVDRGSGLEPDVLSHAFDPFFTTKPQGQGTGLGLPLARQFVEDHDGVLSVQSQPGEGTTAVMWLPIGDDPAARVKR